MPDMHLMGTETFGGFVSKLFFILFPKPWRNDLI